MKSKKTGDEILEWVNKELPETPRSHPTKELSDLEDTSFVHGAWETMYRVRQFILGELDERREDGTEKSD